jgi:hypothetical protein
MEKIKSNLKSRIKNIFSNPIYILFLIVITIFSWVTYAQNTSIISLNLLPPTNLALYGNPTPTTVSISWNYTFTGDEKIIIERRASDVSDFLPINYSHGSSFTDATLVPGTYYYYRVRACLTSTTYCSSYSQPLNGVHLATASSTDTIPLETSTDTSSIDESSNNNTSGSGGTGTVYPTAPLPPTNLILYTPLSSTSTTIPLKWTDNSTNEDKFRIERKLSTASLFSFLHEVSGTTGTMAGYVDNNGVVAGTSYDYRVAACIGTTCSPFITLYGVFIPLPTTTTTTTTNTTTTTTITSETPTNTTTILPTPSAPSNLRLEPIPINTSTSLSLKWTDNSNNEENFKIERKLSTTSSFSILAEKGPNIISHHDSNSIVRGTHYDYRIRACLLSLCSNYTYLAEVSIPIVVTQTSTSPTTEPVPILEPTTNQISPTPTPLPPPPTNTDVASNITLPKIIPTTITPSPTTALPTTPPIVTSDIQEVAKILSEKASITDSDKEIFKTQGGEELLKKDTNNDGVSDYDSIYFYKIDPVKPSPKSVHEGKSVNAGDKILLGFDPTKTELTKVTAEQPKDSPAPVVALYKVKEVKLTEKKEIILKGQALPNSFVTLYIYSTPIMVVVKTDSNGDWQYILDKELENGDHSVYTATVNNTGNIVAKSSGYLFTKTAEAVTFNDLPIVEASANIQKPGLFEGINIYVLIALILAIFITAFVFIGVISKKNNPN